MDQLEIEQEIVALHDFISSWFRGEPQQGRQTYDNGFADRLVESFVNIQPSGKILSKADLTDPIYNGHGSNPNFQIEIEQVEIRHISPDGSLVLATYVEVQHGAINSKPPTNARRSTVLFSKSENKRLKWIHVHETAVPMDQR